jgi:hypothetical protein
MVDVDLPGSATLDGGRSWLYEPVPRLALADVDVRSSEVLTAARAHALFTSELSAYSRATPSQVADAIRFAVRMHGIRGCAAEVAAAYGERPETAAARMRWARTVVESIYARAASTEVGYEDTLPRAS